MIIISAKQMTDIYNSGAKFKADFTNKDDPDNSLTIEMSRYEQDDVVHYMLVRNPEMDPDIDLSEDITVEVIIESATFIELIQFN